MHSQAELLRNSSKMALSTIAPNNSKKGGKWQKTAKLLTCLIPNFVIKKIGKMEKDEEIQAWREKVALCIIILCNCLFLGTITYGINMFICKSDSKEIIFSRIKKDTFDSNIIVGNGKVYKTDEDKYSTGNNLDNYTGLFYKNSKACKKAFGGQLIKGDKMEEDYEPVSDIYWNWSTVFKKKFIVIDDKVYDPRIRHSKALDPLIEKYEGTEIPEHELKEFKPICIECFKDTFYAGKIAKKSPGCVFGDILLYTTSTLIFTLIIVKFLLAIFYSWYSASRPVSIKGTTPVIIQVTCYSEGEEGIRTTLNSLAELEYPDNYKLIVVIADGQIIGEGETRTTPEIILNLCEDLEGSEKSGYVSLVPGHKRYNRAKVFTGNYRSSEKVDKKAKIMVITKEGNVNETMKKGNRGKRDSQVIIMNYFSKMFYNDRMCNLDVEIYKGMKKLFREYEPEDFEILLMVDADTKVDPDALIKLVSVFEKDNKVIGLCGETQILNKFESWVTQIQVFEYYISHHQTKTFESVFGGVTCLPGCFCSYRLKITTDLDGVIKNHSDKKIFPEEVWTCIPLLANPIIVKPYSVFEASSLHEKNLLHLGEDRYLTTLLMKNFYKRKLLFLASAKCSTYVPADYKTLRSQRRRWINSTVHNMFELVMVDKLCGINVFSMQFIIGVELFGTLTLPAAIIFTFVLIASSIMVEPAWIPLIMLAGILGLPAILILLTTGSIQYVYWLIVYVVALPIWNFFLPVYAFWRFDDFSWGDTRKIEEASTTSKKKDLVDEFDASDLEFVEFDGLKNEITAGNY